MILKNQIIFRIQELVLLLCIFLLQGCHVPQQEFRAYSVNNAEWNMVERCGYQGCYPIVDFLTSKDLTIRLQFDNDWQTKKFFEIRILFESIKKDFTFDPSNFTVKLNNGDTLKAHIFACGGSLPRGMDFLIYPSLRAPIHLKNHEGCFLLFFDHTQLSGNDEVEMNLSEALTSSGKPVDVPSVKFKRSIGLK